MKKYLFSILFFVLALLIVSSCKDEVQEDDNETFPITYSMNYQAVFGKPWKVQLSSNQKTKEIQLFINDSLIKSWSGHEAKIEETFDLTKLGLGAKGVTIKATTTDGKEYAENQTIHILSDIEPVYAKAEIKALYPHNTEDFTQGLEIVDGVLFESTGDPDHKGATKVMRKDLKTGSVQKENQLDGNYFGEGITVLDNQVYQITWTSQKCFVYNATTLERNATSYTYTGEGWGLTNDGKQIIMSDGSERIFFRDPKTFRTTKTISVYDNKGPIKNLNEIEYVNGFIYANVWMTNKIVVIEASTGKVLKNIDCSEFEAKAKGNGDVLNGIAYDRSAHVFYLTGKYWPYLGQVEFK